MVTASGIVFVRHKGKIRSIETDRLLRHPAHPCNTLAWSFERWCRLSNCVAFALLAPFSKAYHVPVGSASLGIGSSRRWQRSMNWLCAAALSVRELPYHLEMN